MLHHKNNKISSKMLGYGCNLLVLQFVTSIFKWKINTVFVELQ